MKHGNDDLYEKTLVDDRIYTYVGLVILIGGTLFVFCANYDLYLAIFTVFIFVFWEKW